MAEDDRMVDVIDPPVDESESNGRGPHGANADTETDDLSEDDMFGKLVMLPFTEARARALEDFDRKFLTAALARHNGNIARTARALGLHRQSLQKLMGRRGIKSVRVPGTPASTGHAD
ncbi:MAG: helix-turn-helix domain-containing protein [Gemmatimonadaceae bacterium]